MANFISISATGTSLVRLLNAAFAEPPVPVENKTTKAILVQTEDFDPENQKIQRPALSIFLYRVDFNKTTRAAWSSVGGHDGRAHLPLDLHFLITPWSGNAEEEHAILGRAMQCLESFPILSGPLLHQSGGWAPNEAVQLVLEEVSTEAVMRTFDSLPVEYHLSVPYIARVVRVDSRDVNASPPASTLVTAISPSPVP